MKKTIYEVFTPRKHQVNEDMYITRVVHEKDLRDALLGHRHVILHGDSGCGKTWLYKKVFNEDDICYSVVNLASATKSALGSIRKAIKNSLDRSGGKTLTEVEEAKSGGLTAPLASAELSHTKTYSVSEREPYEAALAHIRDVAKKRRAVLVFDNLEMIFEDKDLMDELAGLIVLVDDESYAKYDVKLLLVGTPSSIRDYFNSTPTRATVVNRLIEIPEVNRMSEVEAQNLVERGFESELSIFIRRNQKYSIIRHVSWVSHRIPQSLHEYCLELAKLSERSGEVYEDLLNTCDRAWLSDSLSNAYAVVENLMNERETKIGRRNQILFVLGETQLEEFKPSEIEELVRINFGASAEGKTLNIGGMMAEMAAGNSSILRRSPKGDAFMFKDPKFRLCIRAMLRKDSALNIVTRIPISEI